MSVSTHMTALDEQVMAIMANPPKGEPPDPFLAFADQATLAEARTIFLWAKEYDLFEQETLDQVLDSCLAEELTDDNEGWQTTCPYTRLAVFSLGQVLAKPYGIFREMTAAGLPPQLALSVVVSTMMADQGNDS